MRANLTPLCLVLATLAAFAAEPRPKVEVTVQLISLAGDVDDLALWDGRKATPVTLSADFFGPRVRYTGDARLRLIRPDKPATAPATTKEPDAPPATVQPPPGPVVAWVDLPPGIGPRTFILLVRPEPERNGIWAIEDENQRFPAGAIRFLNLCEFPVSVGEGEKATRLAAKDAAVVKPGVPAGRYYDVPLFSEEDGMRRLAYHLHFFPAPDRRTLLFILPGEKGTGLIRLQPVEDSTSTGLGGSPHDAKIPIPGVKK
jgi:hypothetical protein